MSGLPSGADVVRPSTQVRKVPIGDISRRSGQESWHHQANQHHEQAVPAQDAGLVFFSVRKGSPAVSLNVMGEAF